jgi:hypothetical protein
MVSTMGRANDLCGEQIVRNPRQTRYANEKFESRSLGDCRNYPWVDMLAER